MMRTVLRVLCLLTLAEAAQAADDVWWSLRPLAQPSPPSAAPDGFASWPRTPVDRFVLARLRGKSLEPAPEADRRTLLRRLTFDLVGLPPAPEEVEAFARDPSPDAYEQVVERLLASPHYGERWARHWMDVAHYAETHGHDQDRPRPNAWPYRDYLVRAFNADKPYARFVAEQIAGDVLWPDDADAVSALGFLATGPWDESSLRDIREDSIDRQIGRYLDRDDMVTTALATFTSTTVHCARCHDHKFDPITTQEYYGLQAVFAGVEKAERAFDTDPKTAAQRRRLVLEQAKVRLARLPTLPFSFALALLERQVEQQAAALPPQRLVYAAAHDFKPDGSFRPLLRPRTVHVLKRGDIHKPGAEARPGALAMLAQLDPKFQLSDADDEGSRRAALARWLVDAENVLTWRSAVNRVWQYHFGRGLVDTPNDFGRMGSLPSHPELLDWLAGWFSDGGGSLKQLHRLIVCSAAYRQASRHDPRFAEVDADNRLLWRMNRRRLDAESLRDSVLLLAGQLDHTMGGPSVKQFVESPGIHVTPKVDYDAFGIDRPEQRRRSVYRFIFRTLPDPFLEALDCPDAAQLTPVRTNSMSALQALALLHDRFMVRMSERLAARAETAACDLPAQIGQVYRWALQREPTPSEARTLIAYAEKHGLANACRMLLNSNEFLFVN